MSETVEVRSPIVLIADDDAAVRIIMREVLEQVGFKVVEAGDGLAALQCYKESSPDVIMLDVEMPGLDGFSVCKAIRNQEMGRQTPIFIVTGHDDAESVDRAYHLGATDFISKPIAWPVLAHRVRYILRSSDAFNDLTGLIMAVPDLILLLDSNGKIKERLSSVDTKGSKLTKTFQGEYFESVFPHERSTRVRENIKMAIDTGQPQIHEHPHADGGRYFETRFVARDNHAVLAIVRDITERKETEAQIYKLAFYDRLTGLPNRELFSQHLDDSIRIARENDCAMAILFIDLDRFKRINDTLGHSIGDTLLKAVAQRLERCTRPSDQVGRMKHHGTGDSRLARLGGDEFVIVLHDIGSKQGAASVSSRIVAALSDPFSCDGHQFVISPSIGIAMFPQDGQDREQLLMNADSAMYRAKATGRNNYKFYSETMKTKSLHRLDLEHELRKAIDSENFMLHYQPKVDIASWSIVGVEALLRWHHDERGWIGPADFIPVAEETGLIVPLGEWVLRQACQQLRKWRATSMANLSVAVNISSQQVHADDLLGTIKRSVSAAEVDPGLVELEITESLLMRDVEGTIATLKMLREFGMKISVDDFGTGYSSLSYLKRFPISTLKIDRSFVQDLHKNNDDAAICAAILAMASKLGLSVVAEGVELEEQLEFLRRHGCEQIQGFLFSKPLPVAELETLVLRQLDAPEKVAG